MSSKFQMIIVAWRLYHMNIPYFALFWLGIAVPWKSTTTTIIFIAFKYMLIPKVSCTKISPQTFPTSPFLVAGVLVGAGRQHHGSHQHDQREPAGHSSLHSQQPPKLTGRMASFITIDGVSIMGKWMSQLFLLTKAFLSGTSKPYFE